MAVLESVAKARELFAQALLLDPEDFHSWIELARLEQICGNLAAAKGAALKEQQAAQNRRDLSVSHHELGDIEIALGNLAAAQGQYQATLDILQILTKGDPSNSEWQRDLSISHERLGDIETAKGNLVVARYHYQAALDIAQILVKGIPAIANGSTIYAIAR